MDHFLNASLFPHPLLELWTCIVVVVVVAVYQIGARKRRTPENTILSQPCCRCVSTDRPNREGSQLAASLEGEPGPAPAGKTLPHSYPETRFRRERARGMYEK